ncbi:hypothetical protein BSKO_10036 [Bryopsis sp. KO-2023]|nr:hypothetical protein BSKO_10036 [Bryopsis sp. KO-2023]
MAWNKLAIVVFVVSLASPALCIRPLRFEGGEASLGRNDRVHGRGLRIFGGVLLNGLANALQRPAQGELLRAFATLVAGQAGRGASVTVQDGFLSINGVEGSQDFNVEIQTDPITGQSFTIDPTTGAQIFVDPFTGLPLTDTGDQIQFQNSGFVAAGPGVQFDQFGQAFTIDPITGAQVNVDPNTGLPLNPVGADPFGGAGQIPNQFGQFPNQGFDPFTGLPTPQVTFSGRARVGAERESPTHEPTIQHRRLKAGFGSWGQRRDNTFDASIRTFRATIDKIDYGDLYTKAQAEYCAFYESTMLLSLCASRSGLLPSPVTCCRALHAFLDEGKCMCEPERFTLPPSETMQHLLRFKSICIGFGFRRVRFRVPHNLADLRVDGQCDPANKAPPLGKMNPSFLKSPRGRQLPTNPPPRFDQMYKSPPVGPYDVSNTQITVERRSPSILNNSFSFSMKFEAQIFYPSNKKREVLDGDRNILKPVLAEGTGLFSVVVFSAGLGDSLSWHKRKVTLLASFGFVVIVPMSVSLITYPLSERHLDAWADDLIHALEFSKAQTQKRTSFLHARLRVDRYGIAGVSHGSAAAFLAAKKARSEKRLNVVAMAAVATPCNHAGNQCSKTVEAARQLKGVHVLFLSGTDDGVSPTRVTGFLIEEVAKESNVFGVYLDGMTHCFSERDPAEWPFSTDECGLGTTPPQKGIATLAVNLGRFFTRTLNNDKIVNTGLKRLR